MSGMCKLKVTSNQKHQEYSQCVDLTKNEYLSQERSDIREVAQRFRPLLKSSALNEVILSIKILQKERNVQ
jgi:hypothetical protein